MIVVDASALLEALLPTGSAWAVRERLLTSGELHAPHLIDVECAHALRRWVAQDRMSPALAETVVADLTDFPIARHAHHPWVWRIWELRNNFTAYDAAYVSLAEALGAPLVTRDARLAAAPGHSAAVEVI